MPIILLLSANILKCYTGIRSHAKSVFMSVSFGCVTLVTIDY